MIEGPPNNEDKEGNEKNNLSDEIKKMVSFYVEEISKLKRQSLRPEKYNHLIDEVESEGLFIILRHEDILQAHFKDLENLQPEIKEKINSLMKQEENIHEKNFELGEKSLESLEENVKVFEKEEENFSKSIEEIEKYVEEKKEEHLVGMISTLKDKYEKSLGEFLKTTDKSQKKIASLYRNFLSETNKHIAEQIKEVLNENKIENLLSFEARIALNQLADNFITNCLEKLKKAKDLYNEEQAEQN